MLDAQPGLTHKFVRQLECQGKLLNCYTQNVDGLDRLAGIEHLVECHGSFSHSVCMICGDRVKTELLKDHIVEQNVPRCVSCGEGVMKPEIVFFGEQLGSHFYSSLEHDIEKCDLVLVIGSSLSVHPVSSIPRWFVMCDSLDRVRGSVPQILINREPLSDFTFDVEFFGDCDLVLGHISSQLGDDFFSDLCGRDVMLQRSELELGDPESGILTGLVVF
ncbi:NAD-dependent protein deacetylase sirtuin-1-like [Octopus sinensis]|uniref:NAD-dependent protein deacetylase sirtuin-1-like n=1 Tax=Octopus sinensis TaxID=2607531 RepID=A0A6P7U164_9MOLL|nr:NAD-dependent protein deacetylase sirtuin-1-like [Octopus sinensis]